MRIFIYMFALLAAVTPVSTWAEESGFAGAVGALSRGFLTQQDQFGFGGGTDNYFARLRFQDANGDIRSRLSFGFDHDDATILFDDSYLEYHRGLWAIGAGAKDRHWGPSRFTSLVLSDNTRPIPGLYLSRAPAQIDSPWLGWIGAVSGDILVGQLAEHTAPAKTKLLGMRLGVNPAPGWELELVRMVEFGGDGRDNSLGTFVKILSGLEDANSIVSNQIAGLGLSYQLPSLPLRGYFQAVGEDEAGYLPSCFFYLSGAEYETHFAGRPARFTLEAVDTRVSRTASGFCGPNTAYRNGQYASGYSHYGATMGAPIDTEGTSITLYGEHALRSVDLFWSFGHYDINRTSLATHRLTPLRADGVLTAVGLSTMWFETTVSGVIAYQGFDLTEAASGVSVGVQLHRSF